MVQFANDIHFGWIDGEAIFLDVTRDRFFLGSPRLRSALRLVEVDGTRVRDPALLALLNDNGLELTSDPMLSSHVLPPARSDLGEIAAHAVSARSVRQAILTQCRAALDLKALPLRVVIHDLRRRKTVSTSKARDGRTINDYAAAFRRSEKYFPSDQKCLRRSIALARHVIGRGHDATVVLGVSLRPFDAHCWVQHDDVVLNDSLESIGRYTPVLVV